LTLRPLAGEWLRVLTPRWSHAPLGGAGAAITGGRFNPPGVEALYLSDDVATAWAEYQQMGAVPRPGLIADYEIGAEAVADLRNADVRQQLQIEEEDLRCPWRQLVRIEKRGPPTWRIARDLRTVGAQALCYRSVVRPEGANLVLWLDVDKPARLHVEDPSGDLPHDAASWPTDVP
jgi:RES domain-containing protein